jgi:Fe-S-cluster-containing hydrogenase component 2
MMDAKSEIYVRLRDHIDNMPVGLPASESGSEIKILKHLFTPQEAEIALELSALPEPLERIHKRLKKTGITVEDLGNKLDTMVKKGAILGGKIFEKRGGGKYYSKSMLAIGMYELQLGNLSKELEKDFQDYLNEKFYKVFHSPKTSQMRTIPINKVITTNRYVGSYDDAKEIVNNTSDKIAVAKCICRDGKDLLENPCKHSDIRETCLMFEDIASFVIDSGSAREITKNEALEILDRAENAGMVLQPENNQKPNFICCCCGCCCNVLTTAKKFPQPAEYFHSNYYASVDNELCGSCLECLEKCQMEALSNDNNSTNVNRDKCIGCGVCAATCANGAIELKSKKDIYIPPKNHDDLYKKIMFERYGILGMLKIMPKMLFKQKI